MDENKTAETVSEGGAKSSMFPMMIGALLLLVVAVVFYVTTAKPVAEVAPVVTEQLPGGSSPESIPVGEADQAAVAITVQGTSDEIADIEADLNATDLKVLDGVDSI